MGVVNDLSSRARCRPSACLAAGECRPASLTILKWAARAGVAPAGYARSFPCPPWRRPADLTSPASSSALADAATRLGPPLLDRRNPGTGRAVGTLARGESGSRTCRIAYVDETPGIRLTFAYGTVPATSNAAKNASRSSAMSRTRVVRDSRLFAAGQSADVSRLSLDARSQRRFARDSLAAMVRATAREMTDADVLSRISTVPARYCVRSRRGHHNDPARVHDLVVGLRGRLRRRQFLLFCNVFRVSRPLNSPGALLTSPVRQSRSVPG